MFLTKKHLSRRTVLKGAGAVISLPLLDAMIPAGTALADTAAVVKPRLGYVYFPHGAVQKFWTPEGAGKDFKFSRILKPLEGMRDYVTVVSNLRNKPAESTDPHGIIEATWLTCLAPTVRGEGPAMPASPSIRWPRARSGRTRRCRRWSCAASPAAPSITAVPARDCRWKAIRATSSRPCSVRAIPMPSARVCCNPRAACSTTCRNPARASAARWMVPTAPW